MLLDAGADPEAEDPYGYKAVEWAELFCDQYATEDHCGLIDLFAWLVEQVNCFYTLPNNLLNKEIKRLVSLN